MGEQVQLYPHIEPDMKEWPIYKLTINRKSFIEELEAFTVQQILSDPDINIRSLLAKVLYQERARISMKPWRVDPPDERTFWKKVKEDLEEFAQPDKAGQAKEKHAEVLRRIINRYAEEIVGSFMPAAYSRARQMLTFLFKRLLINRGKRRVWGKKEQLYHRIKLYGSSEKIRKLAKIGTVVMVPTHFSNLDSLLIGYAIDLKVGLPSFSWGAGLNLYNFGPLAYFLNRMGTYRVDRRKKNPVYLHVLKNMSTLTMERGVHSLFFPGGTRSRSGEVETKFKLGLLGTTIEAQRMLCQKGSNNKVFIVPLILDYHFVLEGKFLIEQHLQAIGGAHYAAIRDESRSKRKLLKFLLQFYRESSEIVMSLGEPFDVLGNFVDEQGISRSEDGSPIEVEDYFKHNGVVTEDAQRERVYTSILSDRILERFLKDNVVLTSHVIAFTAFQCIVERHQDLDIMGLITLPLEDFQLTLDELTMQVDRVRAKLLELEEENNVRLSEPIKWDLPDMVLDGLQKLGLYHDKKPLILKDNVVFCQNVKLLYFYHNRLKNYNLESIISTKIVV